MTKYRLFSLLIIVFSVTFSVLTLFSQSIRLDESQSIWVSTKSVPVILKIDAEDVQVPLYTVLLHFWMQILGTDIIIIRVLSLIFFVLTLVVLYKLAYESSNEEVALLSITLFSLSPFLMWYANEGRTYTLFTLAVSLSHLYYLRIWRSGGARGKLGYFLSTLLGLLTHYFFVFLLVTQIFFVITEFIEKVYKSKEEGKTLRESAKKHMHTLTTFFSILILSAFIFAPWLYYVLILGGASNTQPLLPPPTSYNLIQIFVNFIFGFQSQAVQVIFVSFWPLAIMILFLAFTLKKHLNLKNSNYFVIVTFLPVIAAFLISFYKPIFLSRYLILVTPTFFLLVAWLLVNYTKRLFSLMTIGMIILMIAFLVYQNRSEATPVKEDYREVAYDLGKEATPHDIVAVTAPFTIYPIEYSYSGLARVDTIPNWDRYHQGAIPPFRDTVLRTQIDNYKQQYARIFVVFSYDQGYEQAIRNYLDLNYQLLERKRYPSNIELRVYKLRYDLPTQNALKN